MVDIGEAIIGTAFLSPVVIFAILACQWSADPVFAAAAVLALPIGWLIYTFERYLVTFKGRYEHFPTLEFIRSHIKLEKHDDDTIVVNLRAVIPENKQKELSQKMTLNREDFDCIFDPYKSLQKSRILLWKSFRRDQNEREEKLPYVESIEDMFFFDDPGLADFMRSAVANYHTYKATVCAFLLGLLCAIGMTLAFRPEFFLTIQIPQQIDLYRVLGWVLIIMVFVTLTWATIKQSRLRLREALAHEYLLIRLRVPKDKTKCSEKTQSTEM